MEMTSKQHSNNQQLKSEELLISTLCDLLKNDKHVAVGAASPIPGAAALLAKEEQKQINKLLRVTILHSTKYNNFTNGSRELFDCASQGKIDTFFLSGVQIDGEANINLVGTGQYTRLTNRFAGSFGSALMYYVIPKVILFRQEHTPRTLVEKVDFISAPGCSEKNIYRPGGPKYLLTEKALFSFNSKQKKFLLENISKKINEDYVIKNTGFKFDIKNSVRYFKNPSKERLSILRKKVAPMVAEFYPNFASKVWSN